MPVQLQDQKLFGWLKACYPSWQHMMVSENMFHCCFSAGGHPAHQHPINRVQHALSSSMPCL